VLCLDGAVYLVTDAGGAVDIEERVVQALDALATSLKVVGPVETSSHTCYVVSGISETSEQTENLCWCLLSLVGQIFEQDLSIDSAIGQGAQAEANLLSALGNRLGVGKELTTEQKERNRDPLLEELIAHALLLIHRRQGCFDLWVGELRAMRPPHLSANESGLDLIAVGVQEGALVPLIGEAKAREHSPLDAFCEACEKFSQVRRGEYNDELREAIKSMDCGVTNQQLANNLWVSTGRFGAVVGHDQDHSLDPKRASQASAVLEQPSDRLFLVASPFRRMRDYFDALSEELERLAKIVGAGNDAG
jgi:hypothetical protein